MTKRFQDNSFLYLNNLNRFSMCSTLFSRNLHYRPLPFMSPLCASPGFQSGPPPSFCVAFKPQERPV